MTLKEMKEAATAHGIEFKKNATMKKMEELLGLVPSKRMEEAKEAAKEKVFLGYHPVSGEKVYL